MKPWVLAVFVSWAMAVQPDAADSPCQQPFGSRSARSDIGLLEATATTSGIRYRARRYLEAASENGTKGWLSAVTEFDPQSGLQYRVITEGGSERIRNRVLRHVLDTETEWSTKDEAPKSALTAANYVFQSCGESGELVKLSLTPRRKDSRLVNGALFLMPEKGPVRVEGRLAKSPSFWIRWVDVRWQYRDIGGIMLPTQIASTADVRFFGMSTFAMTFEYQMVNGRPVAESAPRESQ